MQTTLLESRLIAGNHTATITSGVTETTIDVPSSDGPVSAGWLSCLCTVHAASKASDAANVIVNERLAI